MVSILYRNIIIFYVISNILGDPNNVIVNSSPFIKINEGFYYFGQERVNWHVADENCRKLGSDLVSFETAQEFDAITEYLKSKGERTEHLHSNLVYSAVGGRRKGGGRETAARDSC